MKASQIITVSILTATILSCSKKVYSEDELKRIAKTDSIRKEQMKMLETENINEQQEIQDALYYDRN